MTDTADAREGKAPEFLHELSEVRDRLGEARAALVHLAGLLRFRSSSKTTCPECDSEVTFRNREGTAEPWCRPCGMAVELSAEQVALKIFDALESAGTSNREAWERCHPTRQVILGLATEEQFYLSAAATGGSAIRPWIDLYPERLSDYQLYSLMCFNADGGFGMVDTGSVAQRIGRFEKPEQVDWQDLRPEQREFFSQWPELARRFRGHPGGAQPE